MTAGDWLILVYLAGVVTFAVMVAGRIHDEARTDPLVSKLSHFWWSRTLVTVIVVGYAALWPGVLLKDLDRWTKWAWGIDDIDSGRDD